MENVENYLTIKNKNGENCRIRILDFFKVDNYPNNQYVAYIFEGDDNNAYISVISEDNGEFNLNKIKDKKEKLLVQEAFLNMSLHKESE